MKRIVLVLLILSQVLMLSGCTGFVIGMTKPVLREMIAKPAFGVFLQEEDLGLAKDAIGGQIKLVEILLKNMKGDKELLLLLCQGYASYGQLLEVKRNALKLQGTSAASKAAKVLTTRIRSFALRGRSFCFQILEQKYKDFGKKALKGDKSFSELLASIKDPADAKALFWLGYAWGYALINGLTEPDLIAQIPQLKAVMQKVIALDEDFFHGAAHLFLATLYAQPKMYGGDLKKSKTHFDKAFTFSKKKLLLIQLYQAQYYANQKDDTKMCKSLLEG
ncbi:MAG TPA: hypothetical protein DCE42_05860, partial [Myxococcales bacterium]|nr:hypothetical protein [Myxococcales bacterium]